MTVVSFARIARRAAKLVPLFFALAPIARLGAQSHATHAAAMSAAEIEAFAKLSLAVSQARDSIQKQIAMPRNATPQMQQALREQLAAQIAQILRDAGVADTTFRRRQLIVSTDSSARTVFDAAIAKLTGAPLPGQITTAATIVKVPDGPVGMHLGHVLNAFAETPKGQGLLPTAMSEAAVAATHAALATRDLANLESMKLHAGHVIHAIDPTVVTMGPGSGYGVKRAALGVATHIDLAAKAQGATSAAQQHAMHAGASARNTVQRADAIVQVAQGIRSATSASDAAALVSQLVSLVNELIAGKDANGDGKVSFEQGEGGLQQCDEHVRLMLAASMPAGR